MFQKLGFLDLNVLQPLTTFVLDKH